MQVRLTQLINPQDKQLKALQELFNPECKYLLYGGSMGSGKSYVLRWAAVSYLIYLYGKTNIKGIAVGLFSEDYPTLKDRQISRIEREFPQWLGDLKDDQINGLSYKLKDEYGGGVILLRNLDDPSKYMSTEFAGEFVEELTRNPQQTFEDLRNRLRYPGIEEVKFMGASNPGGIGHGWVKKFFIDKNIDDPEIERFFYIPATAYDNKYISKTYIKQLESLPDQKRKAYLEGSWDVFAGQFFTEFNRHIHTCDPFIPKKENFHLFVGGMDWGRAAPFSFHLTGIQQKKYEGQVFNRAWTFIEVYGTEKTPREWGVEIEKALEFYGFTLNDINFIEADPRVFVKGDDGSLAIRDQFKNYNDGFLKIRKGSNDRIGGWTNVHNWLSIAPDGEPYWIITKNCKNLIRTLPELIHDETKVEDVDTLGEDHAADECRYMFKAVKWVDAKVGGVGKTPSLRQPKRTARMEEGKQLSVSLDPFASAWTKKKGGGVYYPR